VQSGVLKAYSGLRAQMDALDVLSNNLANVNTAGFKEERAFFTVLSETASAAEARGARAVSGAVATRSAINPTAGSLSLTGRDLDVALVGDGFLTVATAQGVRYTRNGALRLNADGTLATADGLPVMGEKGTIKLASGKIHVSEEGQVSLDGTPVDRLRLVSIDRASALVREGGSLFAAPAGQASEKPADAIVQQGYLEQSNVNPIASVVGLVAIMRQFEAIQKSIHVVMNDLDAKSIEKLGR